MDIWIKNFIIHDLTDYFNHLKISTIIIEQTQVTTHQKKVMLSAVGRDFIVSFKKGENHKR